jgi:hypothetical protein
MSETFHCDDKDTLVAYLYGEIGADRGREVERHLQACTACAQEVDGLQRVRRDLTSWLPPEPDLGFTLTPRAPVDSVSAPVLRPPRWAPVSRLPVWAQLAAAVFIAGIGIAVANVQVRSAPDGLTVTTGWMAPRESPSVPSAAQPAETWRRELAALEQTLRTEMAQARTLNTVASAPARGAAPPVDANALLRRVQGLIDASEGRQRQEMALRLTQLMSDMDLQRRADLMRINQSFGTLQGRTIKNEAGQAEMMNILRRVSVQPQ